MLMNGLDLVISQNQAQVFSLWWSQSSIPLYYDHDDNYP